MADQNAKQQWKKPEVEEVALENEADVLAACSSLSQADKKGSCTFTRCAI